MDWMSAPVAMIGFCGVMVVVTIITAIIGRR